MQRRKTSQKRKSLVVRKSSEIISVDLKNLVSKFFFSIFLKTPPRKILDRPLNLNGCSHFTCELQAEVKNCLDFQYFRRAGPLIFLRKFSRFQKKNRCFFFMFNVYSEGIFGRIIVIERAV